MFEIGTQTMTRHIAIEGYIAERTPPLLPLSFPSGTPSELNGIVSGGSASMFDALGAPLPPSVRQLIADNLVDAPGALATEDGKAKSLPWIFTRLRRHLRETRSRATERQVAAKQAAFNDALGAPAPRYFADMSKYCDAWHNPSTFDADKCAVATYSASLDGPARAAAWSELQAWQTAQDQSSTTFARGSRRSIRAFASGPSRARRSGSR